MRLYLSAGLVLTALLLCSQALPAGEGDAPPSETPAPQAEQPPASIEDLVKALKAEDKDAAKAAMDELALRGREAIEPLMRLQESGEKSASERAAETLARIGVIDGLYAALGLFRDEFEPFEKIGVRFVFHNYGGNPVTIFNPVSPQDPERDYGLGWEITLTGGEGKKPGEMNMNAPRAAQDAGRLNLVTLQPGETYDDVVYLDTLFGVEKLAQDSYALEGRYVVDKAAAEAVGKQAGPKADLREIAITVRPVRFRVALPGMAAVDEETEKKIRQWISDLGSPKYAVRQNAETELDKMGVAALKYLKEAFETTGDPQIKFTAQNLIDKIEKPKDRTVTYLGVRMESQFRGRGVRVQGVMNDSPAMRGGVRDGDAILAVDDSRMRDESDAGVAWLRKQIQSRRAGDRIRLAVQRRDGKEETLEITLDKIDAQLLSQE